MSVPAVEVRAVDKRFGDNVALKDIDLTVDQNEFVSLLGPSGSERRRFCASSPASRSRHTDESS